MASKNLYSYYYLYAIAIKHVSIYFSSISMYLDIKYNFRPNPKCRVEVVRYVERMYSLSEVKSKCGQTDVDGGRVLCDACCELADNMERANEL